MSERISTGQSRLENFEANKKAHQEQQEQKAFDEAVFGNAGLEGNYSDEDKARLEEGAAYEEHMARLAGDDRSAYDRGLDQLENGEVEGAFDRERDAAYMEHAEREAAIENAAFDIEQKIANSKHLRHANELAKRVAELRNKPVSETTIDEDEENLEYLEDRLGNALEAYSETDGADPAMIDLMIDRSAEPRQIKDRRNDDSMELKSADTKSLHDNAPEAVKEEVSDHIEKMRRELDAPLVLSEPDTSWANEDGDKKRPEVDTSWADEPENKEDEKLSEVDTSWANEEESDESKIDTPETDKKEADEEDSAGEGEDKDEESRGDDARVAKLDDMFTDGEKRDKAKKERYSPLVRLAAKLTVLKNSAGRRIESMSARRKATYTVLGIAAVAATALAVKYGMDHDWGFGDNNADTADGVNGAQQENGVDKGGDDSPEPSQEAQPHPDHDPELNGNGVDAEADFGDARTVTPGEGFYQTFQEMNIPQDEWHGLLEKVGPELQKHDWAYRMPNGEWGISQPGTLPKDMLELIQKNR